MGKFDKVNAPTDPADLDRATVTSGALSLQSSIFQRLKRKLGSSKAGQTGWMMVRLAQEDHADHAEAKGAADNMTIEGLGDLVVVAEAATKAMTTSTSRNLGEAVVKGLRGAQGVVQWKSEGGSGRAAGGEK